MKLRTSFVANSSSASYTILIKKPFPVLFDLINRRLFQYTYWERVKEDLSKYSKDFDNIPHLKTKADGLMNRLEKVNKEGIMVDVFRIACEMQHITIKEEADTTVFNGGVAFHGSFVTSMPKIMQEILMVLSFEYPEITTICKWNEEY